MDSLSTKTFSAFPCIVRKAVYKVKSDRRFGLVEVKRQESLFSHCRSSSGWSFMSVVGSCQDKSTLLEKRQQVVVHLSSKETIAGLMLSHTYIPILRAVGRRSHPENFNLSLQLVITNEYHFPKIN